jgi:hypothetical protein
LNFSRGAGKHPLFYLDISTAPRSPDGDSRVLLHTAPSTPTTPRPTHLSSRLSPSRSPSKEIDTGSCSPVTEATFVTTKKRVCVQSNGGRNQQVQPLASHHRGGDFHRGGLLHRKCGRVRAPFSPTILDPEHLHPHPRRCRSKSFETNFRQLPNSIVESERGSFKPKSLRVDGMLCKFREVAAFTLNPNP